MGDNQNKIKFMSNWLKDFDCVWSVFLGPFHDFQFWIWICLFSELSNTQGILFKIRKKVENGVCLIKMVNNDAICSISMLSQICKGKILLQ